MPQYQPGYGEPENNYASGIIGEAINPAVTPNDRFSQMLAPSTVYAQIDDAFKNQLARNQDARSDQQLDLNKQHLALESQAQDNNYQIQQQNYQLQSQKFDQAKQIQDALFPIQQQQANINLATAQANFDALPNQLELQKQTALRNIQSQNDLMTFQHRLANASDDEVQDGSLEDFANSLNLNRNDYQQAMLALNGEKQKPAIATAMQNRQALATQQVQDNVEKQSMATSLGRDVNDPEFLQLYHQYKSAQYFAPEGATVRHDPKTGKLTYVKPANGTAADGTDTIPDVTTRIKTASELARVAMERGNKKEYQKYSSVVDSLMQANQGVANAPQAPQAPANSALNNFQ